MFYAIICAICVKHEYLRKNGQVRTVLCKSRILKGMHDTLIAKATGPLQLRDRLRSDGTAATVYATDSAACGAVRARRCRDQPGGGRADDAGPQSAAAAGVAARFEILGMHFTNELCNNCANHTILRNYITQKLRNIRRHYANNTQSLRK